MYNMFTTTKIKTTYLATIVDCNNIGSVSYSFLRGLGNIAQENTRADILVKNQLWALLDMVTVDKEQELHKQ